MNSENGNQPKQERSRTRWTPPLDKIFADLVVEQIKLGNRPNNVFDKKTWNHIRDEFNRRTDLNFNNNQLRKHLDVLRTRFCNMKSAFVQADFPVEDPCCIGFDLWDDISGQSRPEMVKVKDGSIYEQLCTIFMDTSVHGKYAQSSHFEGLDKSVRNDATVFTSYPGGTVPGNTAPSKLANVNNALTERVVKNKVERKRKQPPDNSLNSEQSRRDQETNQAIAEALQEIIAASRWRAASQTKSSEKFTITNCIKALDRIEGIEEHLYFSALDLFAEPSLRETFLSLKGNDLRLTWLQSKCGKPTTML
ncbi:hypothetical protein K2173_027971 [Erythroxylum novogranatense]|uniref:Myb/SANT-like domain-containing protein n=1 Tax=Erythroxylum novogranatense TaxID=1862640 RepID=A0AAV8U3I6_9ROSI|nr:hypothetical protein K2173_027971 [Erythroxylum novogranatense]